METNNFLEKGVSIVREAAAADEAQKYDVALEKYTLALEHFRLYIKYEKNETLTRGVKERMIQYLGRAEQLKTFLASIEPPKEAAAGEGPSSSPSTPSSEPKVGHRRNKEELEEFLRGRSIEDALHSRVLGQDLAVTGAAKAIRRYYEGWRIGASPLVFLFVGPSGVGKTELAKAVAEMVLGGPYILRVDMSEFQEKHSVSKFLGAPQGYVGSNEGTPFADELRKNPNTVVLLDEVEKAHPDVLTIMLAAFDEGRFTPSKGGTIDCKDCIFIMTSNLGASVITDVMASGHITDASDRSLHSLVETIEPSLRDHFKRDEFLGRIDEVLPFVPFTEDQLRSLVGMFLDKWIAIARNKQEVELLFMPSVFDLIRSRYNPKHGVRSIKHIMDKQVGNALADASAQGRIMKGSRVTVVVIGDDRLGVEVSDPLPDRPRMETTAFQRSIEVGSGSYRSAA